MAGDFQESLWCHIQTNSGNLLVGLCYRSPSSNGYNNDRLLDLMELAVTRNNAKHIMILGDFNFPLPRYRLRTRWSVRRRKCSINSFLQQDTRTLSFPVSNATNTDKTRPAPINPGLHFCWWRKLDRGSYIQRATGEEWPCDPTVELLLGTKESASQQDKRNYWRGDYEKITNALSEIQWSEKLNDKSTETMWLIFKQTITELSDLHVYST